MNRVFRRVARIMGASAATAGLLVLGAGVASAHVTVNPSTTTAGSSAILTFSLSHGCDGSATTAIAIQIPDTITTATPAINPGWTVEKRMEELDTPVDNGHGGQLTERVGQVVYTAKTPLADGYRDTFELSVKLPATVGEQLRFPVVQTCEQGESAWIDVAQEGQDEPDHPAPGFVITAAPAEDAAADGTTAAESATSSNDIGTTTWIALGLGALGLLTGGAALLRGRRAS